MRTVSRRDGSSIDAPTPPLDPRSRPTMSVGLPANSDVALRFIPRRSRTHLESEGPKEACRSPRLRSVVPQRRGRRRRPIRAEASWWHGGGHLLRSTATAPPRLRAGVGDAPARDERTGLAGVRSACVQLAGDCDDLGVGPPRPRAGRRLALTSLPALGGSGCLRRQWVTLARQGPATASGALVVACSGWRWWWWRWYRSGPQHPGSASGGDANVTSLGSGSSRMMVCVTKPHSIGHSPSPVRLVIMAVIRATPLLTSTSRPPGSCPQSMLGRIGRRDRQCATVG